MFVLNFPKHYHTDFHIEIIFMGFHIKKPFSFADVGTKELTIALRFLFIVNCSGTLLLIQTLRGMLDMYYTFLLHSSRKGRSKICLVLAPKAKLQPQII